MAEQRYVNVDRKTQMLMPPDMRDWVAKDDMVHFVMEVVESTPLTGVKIRAHGGGSPAYPPSLMMGLLIYAYAHGIFSGRLIEQATHHHVSIRYLCANLHPDHDTICTFRRENRALIKGVFGQVLKLAGTMGLLKVGTVCVDGTKLLANAAKRRTKENEQLEQAEQRIQQKIDELLAQAEKADANPDSGEGALPEELTNRERLKEKVAQARALLAEATEKRAEARDKERAQWQENPIGDAPGKLSKEPRPKDRINLTDPQSVLMPMKSGGYAPGYNAQLASTGQSCGLIVATHVCQQTNDRQQLAPMADLIKAAVPTVEEIVVDTGYDHAGQIDRVERAAKVKVYCAPQEAAAQEGTPKGRMSRARKRSMEVRTQMKERAASERGKELLKMRSMTVEPIFGMIKTVLGFKRFSLRGLEKVSTEWELVALAFNCRRIARQRGNQNN